MCFDVLIALGSNVGDRRAHLDWAIHQLQRYAEDAFAASSIVDTEALVLPGAEPQANYLNACVRMQTQLHPALLMHELLRIEAQRGRVRTERWSPRTLDLDILTVECAGSPWRGDWPNLIVPHPRLQERPFLLSLAATLRG